MRFRTLVHVVSVMAIVAPTAEAQLTRPLGELMDDFRWRSIGPTNMGGRVTDVEPIQDVLRRWRDVRDLEDDEQRDDVRADLDRRAGGLHG